MKAKLLFRSAFLSLALLCAVAPAAVPSEAWAAGARIDPNGAP